MTGTKVEFNDAFFDTILKSAGVDRLVKEVATQIVTVAKRTAPVDTGAYRDGIELERREAAYRVVYRVVGRDSKTLLVEGKTGNLARAAKSVTRRG